jgi:hypothetical protein
MLIPNHPDDERLSALASHDTDAAADRSLTDHVSSCMRCTDLVSELGALRASLAALPDLTPSRPLQLVPGVEASPAAVDQAGSWARRLFAPFLVAGATLAFVGLVGTALPAFSGMASSGASSFLGGAQSAPSAAEAPALGGGEATASDGQERGVADHASEEPQASAQDGVTERGDGTVADAAGGAGIERSIWPMLLFAGIALMIGALLMRWILAPRAG